MLYGVPIISPNKKYIICGAYDLASGESFTGFELYEFSKNKINLLGIKDLDKWGPTEIKWLNDSTLFIEIKVYDNTRLKETTEYKKLTIK